MNTNNNSINALIKQSDQLKIRPLNREESYLWDLVVQAASDGSFMQAWAWADFKELEGYKTFRYGLFLNQELVGGCIFCLYPHDNKANLLMAQGGPLLPASCREQGMQMLLERAAELAKDVGAIALRVEPLWTQKPIVSPGSSAPQLTYYHLKLC